MASSQQAMVVDIIEAVKRKRKERENNHAAATAGPSEPISTNRGNKLVRNAEYVQKGRLNIPSSVSSQKQFIEFNGYRRSIISRRPLQYDDDGDLVEHEDELEDGNASPAEEDVYKDTKLEEIFMPLTATSDLPNHPSMSAPYYEKGLPEMINNLEEDLHRQQDTLWKLKALWTQLRGDPVWAPVENFHDGFDDWLLGEPGPSTVPANSTIRDHAPGTASQEDDTQMHEAKDTIEANGSFGQGSTENPDIHHGPNQEAAQANGAPTNEDDASIESGGAGKARANGKTTVGGETGAEQTTNGDASGKHQGIDVAAADASLLKATEDALSQSGEENNSQPQSHRMTTRARANRGSRSPSRSRSDSAPSSVRQIHPFFQFPMSAVSDENAGLPPPLADESRACLLQYVSKQEEIVRQQRTLLESLRKALAMRQNVLRWTKAEAHVGEMSDGEDWYDKEEWNLDADLIKGKEEEEDDDRGGKTRRRARGEKNN